MSPRVGLTSATILEAATLIADTQGFEAVTLASLAQHLERFKHLDLDDWQNNEREPAPIRFGGDSRFFIYYL
ncbi:hypothetical protein [Paenibacillus alvei]|uniref:hypothetical protein n=1 Tax=Paenibacillus alvei TaxID=44250 RepID=UPI003AF24EA8